MARFQRPVRRQAGDYLERELLAQRLGPWPAALAGCGVLLGIAVAASFGIPAALAIGVVLLGGSLPAWRRDRKARAALWKGHVAERQIGRALEQAVTAKGCAIAHNVTTVLDSGDIDHIVTTPQGAWVVETKYRRVPSDRLSDVLRRLHACRTGVEALLAPGTPVRACLVLAYEEEPVRAMRDGINVYNNRTFRSEFHSTPQGRTRRCRGRHGRVADDLAAE